MLYQSDEPTFARRLNTELFSVLATPASHTLRMRISRHFATVLVLLVAVVLALSVASTAPGQLPVENPLVTRFFPHVAAVALVVAVCLFPAGRIGWALLAFAPGFLLSAWIEAQDAGVFAQMGLHSVTFFALSLGFNLALGLSLGFGARWVLQNAERLLPRLSPDVTLIAALVGMVGIIGGIAAFTMVYLAEHHWQMQSEAQVLGDAWASAFRVLRGGLITGAIIALLLLPPPKRADLVPLAALIGVFAVLAVTHRIWDLHSLHLAPVVIALVSRSILQLNNAILGSLIGLVVNSLITGFPTEPHTGEYIAETLAIAAITFGDLFLLQRRRRSGLRLQNLHRLLKSQELSKIGFFVFLRGSDRMALDAPAQGLLGLGETCDLAQVLARVETAARDDIAARLLNAGPMAAELNAPLIGNSAGQRRMARIFCQGVDLYNGEKAVFGSIVDISAQYETQAELADTLEKLRAEKALQAQLFAVVSHEMRSPASIVQHLADGLTERPDTAPDVAPTISRLIRHLLAIMEDVRFVMRPDHLPQIKAEPVDMAEFAAAICSDFDPLARQHGITIRIDNALPPDALVLTDEVRLRQIAGNLIRNAILHSGGSQITLRLQAGPVARDGTAQMNIEIRDDGRGIPPALQPHLFEPFSRSTVGVFSQADGTGLGMYVVKSLLDRMGGTVRLTSAAGRGTVFDLALPITLVPRAKLPLGPIAPMAPLARSVLLVEDNALLAELTFARLQRLFDRVQTVPTAEAALDIISRQPPDLLLTDQNLPGRTGTELVAELRARGFAGQIIALTGSQTDGFEDRFTAAGGDGILNKPFDARALMQLVQAAGS